MTAFASITLNDSIPQAIEFVPSSIDQNQVAHLYSEGETGFDSRMHISLGAKLPKAGGTVARVTAKVVIPIMDNTDNTLKVGECIGSVEFVIPKRALETDRNNLLALTKEFLSDASVIAAVGNLESVY